LAPRLGGISAQMFEVAEVKVNYSRRSMKYHTDKKIMLGPNGFDGSLLTN
jgi:hypothetical protein